LTHPRALGWPLALALLASTAATGPARAANPEEGVVGGRLVLKAGGKVVSLADAAEALGGELIGLSLRRGSQVVEATLNGDGYFVLRGPPGAYVVEYLRAGKRAEFFAPQELRLHSGRATCVGTLTLELDRIENLGANVDNHVSVSDECGATAAQLRQLDGGTEPELVEIARAGPKVTPYDPVTWREVISGFLLEGSYHSPALVVRGLFHLPRLGSASRVEPLFLVGGGVLSQDGGGGGGDVLAGAGISWWALDVFALGGYRWASTVESPATPLAEGAVVAGALRLNTELFGLGVRTEFLPERTTSLTLDVRPFALLGWLL
jgi:hypothetical protein